MSLPERTAPVRLTAVLDLVVDLVVVELAVWTLAYHGGLWLGGTRLQVAVVAATVGVAAAWWVLRHRSGPQPAEPGTQVAITPWAAGAVALAVVAVGLLATERYTIFWFAALAALGSAAAGIRTHRDRAATRVRTGAAVVLGFAVIAALASAMQVDWIEDNRYYVDRAFAIRDAPGPLPVGRDTFFSADGRYPSLVPENDLASLEGFVGTAASFFGGHPMSWLSYLVHPLFAFLGVLALWRAARALGAHRPDLVAILGTVGVYLVSLQSEIGTRSFSSRTGRNGFVVFLVPLLVAYTVELMRRPGAASAVRLVAAGVVSGGFTLSALPAAPVVVLGAAVASWQRPERWRQAWWGAGAALAVAAYYGALVVASTAIGRSPTDLEGRVIAVARAGGLWRIALGRDGSFIPLTLVILLAWALAQSRTLRRFVIAAPLATLVVALSPPSLWVLGKTAAATAIVRLAWSIPLGLLIGTVGAALWERRRYVGPALAVGLLAVVALAVPRVPVPRLGVPGWDVPAIAESARRLVALAPDGGAVAASTRLLELVPVVTNRVYPVSVTENSIRELAQYDLPGLEPEARLEVLSWMMNGTMGREPHRLVAALDAAGIDAVCLKQSVRSRDMRATLRAAGFEPAGRDDYCKFWVRSAG